MRVKDNSYKIILDLCGGTGGWSDPYAAAGYEVHIVDPFDRGAVGVCTNKEQAKGTRHYRNYVDVRLMEYVKEVEKGKISIHGILCAPPCTVFANSGARWPRSQEEMLEGISVMDACLRMVAIYKPQWWALENPIGKMRKYLGPPSLMFNPCDYGDPYTKKTCLWGEFHIPVKTPVEPTEGSKMHLLFGGKSAKTKRERSKTPAGFASAFFRANP